MPAVNAMRICCVADVAGPWVEPDFHSALIERCKRPWTVPVDQIPNEILATFIRQRIALQLVIPETRRRLAHGIKDDSELYDGELSEALREAGAADPGTDRDTDARR